MAEPETISPEALNATFHTLSAEADLLLQKGSFHEAMEIYTKALEIRPDDKHCLVSRSRCYIQIGTPQLGLQDAEKSLKNSPDFFKGIFQKGEALYAQGDFEMALLYYHRGNKLRPELSDFRIGIQKAREAIDNSIGNAKTMKIHVPETLRKNWATLSQEKHDEKDEKIGLNDDLTPSMEIKLLGELYQDKLYLSELIKDRDFVEHPDENVSQLVNDGLRYLHTRIDFWRQQFPLYARPKGRKIVPDELQTKSHQKQKAIHHK